MNRRSFLRRVLVGGVGLAVTGVPVLRAMADVPLRIDPEFSLEAADRVLKDIYMPAIMRDLNARNILWTTLEARR